MLTTDSGKGTSCAATYAGISKAVQTIVRSIVADRFGGSSRGAHTAAAIARTSSDRYQSDGRVLADVSTWNATAAATAVAAIRTNVRFDTSFGGAH